MRQLIALLVIAALFSLALGQTSNAADGPPQVKDDIRAYSIDPPGEDGTITASEFAAGNYGSNYSDQLPMYASLADKAGALKTSALTTYWHTMQFGPDSIAVTESPETGVTIYRDSFGIPHVYADTSDEASFGLGYATAQDRLFEMDVFRHAAEGTLASFLGAGDNDAYLKRDEDTRRQGYTAKEVQKMYDDFDNKFGKLGKQVQDGLQAYADGVNAYIAQLGRNPHNCPVEYDAGSSDQCPVTIDQWTPEDTLYIAILQLRVFGETAGGELTNAAFYSSLVKHDGRNLGTKIYNDFMFQNDPSSPTTIPKADGNFHTQNLGKLNMKSVAIPDDATKVAERQAQVAARDQRTLASIGFVTGKPESNAILVSKQLSATGHPLETGNPQVGYSNPGFFMDIDVHAPGVDFRGPAVPGTSALIPLGRGADYAWTLTTGYSDAVDTRAELLCDPKGKKITEDSNYYMFKGKCTKMQSRTETIDVGVTPVSSNQQPSSEDETIYRTVHGPVFDRGKVNGKPVAFAKQRMFWKKEVDSIPAFYKWNTTTHSVKAFGKAAQGFTMSFNSFFANAKDIGYFHVGTYPVRAKGTSPSLPTWGTGQWEWKGRRPFRLQPHVVDPKTGWIANWNSKPAAGWDSYDAPKWGSEQRVRLIDDDMESLTKNGGKVTLADLANVVRDIATRDVRGVYLGPKMLKLAESRRASQKGNAGTALQVVSDWIDKGARRLNRDHNDAEDNGEALAIFDQWYLDVIHKVFDDELGKDTYQFAAPLTDYSPARGSSFYFGFNNYLDDAFSGRRMSLDYCDDRSTAKVESCADDVTGALLQALVSLTKDQGADMSKWTTPAENIVFQEFGAGSVDDIPWQNRGTHNQLVEVLGHQVPGPTASPQP
ncbi:MAG: penicillin acylase family protein [Actinomycetota bacterium]